MKYGKKYKITYKIPSVHRVQRTGVATYIGQHLDGAGHVVLELSGRPEFGTTEVREDWITQPVEQVADDAQCYMDRRVRS